MSGHSKWSQVKHKKAITDAKKGKVFSKMAREIAVAAKTGGPEAHTNPRLRAAIDRARAIGLPKDNIERAIKRANGAGEEETLYEFLLEATAHGRVGILIEGITDSKNRTFAEVRHILTERGARLAEPGALLWNFEKIGILEIRQEENPEKTSEEIEFAFIDSGVKDFSHIQGAWITETPFTERECVRSELEKRGIKIQEAGHDFKPRSPLVLSEEEKKPVDALLDALTEHDDVQEVYTNLEE